MTDQVKNIANQITSILVAGIGAEEVYLFGLQVQGNTNADSDIDMLVVTNLKGKKKIEITQQARRLLLKKIFMPIDILVCDSADFNRKKQNQTTFEYMIVTEGIKLYG